MDPDATLYRLASASAESDHSEAASAADDLLKWLARDGFLPRFSTRVEDHTREMDSPVLTFLYGVLCGALDSEGRRSAMSAIAAIRSYHERREEGE